MRMILLFRRLIQAQPGASSYFLLTAMTARNSGSLQFVRGLWEWRASPTLLSLSPKRKLSDQQIIRTWQEPCPSAAVAPAVCGGWSSGCRLASGIGHEALGLRAPGRGVAENVAPEP